MRISLADRESELMDVLWDKGPSTVSEAQAQVSDQLAYTTVLTILRKLEAKGYVGHTGAGRAHRYHALIERAAAQEGALKALAAHHMMERSRRKPSSVVSARGDAPERDGLKSQSRQRVDELAQEVSAQPACPSHGRCRS